jgi:hypothetical protein
VFIACSWDLLTSPSGVAFRFSLRRCWYNSRGAAALELRSASCWLRFSSYPNGWRRLYVTRALDDTTETRVARSDGVDMCRESDQGIPRQPFDPAQRDMLTRYTLE